MAYYDTRNEARRISKLASQNISREQTKRECKAFYEDNRIDVLHVHNPITAFIHNYYAKKN